MSKRENNMSSWGSKKSELSPLPIKIGLVDAHVEGGRCLKDAESSAMCGKRGVGSRTRQMRSNRGDEVHHYSGSLVTIIFTRYSDKDRG